MIGNRYGFELLVIQNSNLILAHFYPADAPEGGRKTL